MRFTVRISNTLRCITDGLPQKVSVERAEPLTVSQLAAELGVPPILVVNAFVNGVKQDLNHQLIDDAEIAFMGPVAGG